MNQVKAKAEDRLWMIRSHSKLLGPMPFQELKKYLHGSKELKESDEICSGNGYWFFLREKELVEKFVTNKEPQPFNPVSEAADTGD